jgi:hypothetical protein
MSYANTIFSPAYFFQSKSANAKVDIMENNIAEKNIFIFFIFLLIVI